MFDNNLNIRDRKGNQSVLMTKGLLFSPQNLNYFEIDKEMLLWNTKNKSTL